MHTALLSWLGSLYFCFVFPLSSRALNIDQYQRQDTRKDGQTAESYVPHVQSFLSIELILTAVWFACYNRIQ